MYREIITAYSENYTKHINTLYGQYAVFFNFMRSAISLASCVSS
jgi:hypothetical protein